MISKAIFQVFHKSQIRPIMKKVILSLAMFILFIFMLTAQEEDGPVLTWEIPSYDYGTVYTDDLPETKLAIVFENTGNQPLVLTNVRACCGTRVTHWPKEPVMPGVKDTIKIEFNLVPRPHRIRRSVVASSNCTESNNKVFRITGEVVQREENP